MNRSKHFITYLLMLVSLILLVAPAIPHHHHGTEVICMKNDLPKGDCCGGHSHHHTADDACCNGDCMTRFHSTNLSSNSDSMQPHFLFAVILFTDPLLKLLTEPLLSKEWVASIYLEHLHGTWTSHAVGLRAPPSVL